MEPAYIIKAPYYSEIQERLENTHALLEKLQTEHYDAVGKWDVYCRSLDSGITWIEEAQNLLKNLPVQQVP